MIINIVHAVHSVHIVHTVHTVLPVHTVHTYVHTYGSCNSNRNSHTISHGESNITCLTMLAAYASHTAPVAVVVDNLLTYTCLMKQTNTIIFSDRAYLHMVLYKFLTTIWPVMCNYSSIYIYTYILNILYDVVGYFITFIYTHIYICMCIERDVSLSLCLCIHICMNLYWAYIYMVYIYLYMYI